MPYFALLFFTNIFSGTVTALAGFLGQKLAFFLSGIAAMTFIFTIFVVATSVLVNSIVPILPSSLQTACMFLPSSLPQLITVFLTFDGLHGIYLRQNSQIKAMMTS